MPSYTDNHAFQLFADDETPWEHRSDFQKLDDRTPIVDTDANRTNYNPKTDSLYLASDTETLYRGNGTSWVEIRALGSGGGGDVSGVEGIASTHDHVGPLRQGAYHGTAGSGVAFWAQSGLQFNSVVVDTDLTGLTTTTLTIELANYEGGAANPATVGSVDVTVSGGPERVDLSGLPAIPSNGEYVLARMASPNGEVIPCRRVLDTNFGTAGYDEHTYPTIDFLRGTNINEAGDFGAEAYYYYFFDIQIGDATTRVTSPWSTDVDEIYMRPRDPAEEFDVGPRALWFDTS